jgi:GNAT superfamily N-acetyltransferase
MAEIYAIYVLKQRWRNGIGYHLYKTACETFQRNGFSKSLPLGARHEP